MPVVLITLRLTCPAVSVEGAVAVMLVSLFTVNEEALVVPNFTCVVVRNPVPVIVTTVPPAMGP